MRGAVTEAPAIDTGQDGFDSREAVTDDAFLGGALAISQPADGYRAGMDAVVLAGAVALPDAKSAPRDGIRLLDAGCGVGTVGLALALRAPHGRIDLVEREADLAKLARHNAIRNGLSERVSVIEADLLRPRARLQPDRYTHAVSNPPFYVATDIRSPQNALRARAHAFGASDLDAWIAALHRSLVGRGLLTLIYPAENLVALMGALGANARFGAVQVVPVYSRDDGRPARRVLVQACKGSRAPSVLRPPLYLHEMGAHAFREDVRRVMTGPAALDIWDR
ncbi:MAG: methyltransferase [Pseudomonadota bacterium]